jgi:hypothetical protein
MLQCSLGFCREQIFLYFLCNLLRSGWDWLLARVRVTLRLTVSHSVGLGVEPQVNWQLRSWPVRVPSPTRGRDSPFSVIVSNLCQYVHGCLQFYVFHIFFYMHYISRPLSVQAGYNRLCPTNFSSNYRGNLDTWTVVHEAAAKFKPILNSMTGVAFSLISNMFIFMILNNLCLLLA